MTQPYVITISSEKGGVGKTTVATNLAIYLKALDENLPVTLFSFDNHFSLDRMYRIGQGKGPGTIADLFAGRPVAELCELGQFGVQFIPSSRDLPELRHRVAAPETLARLLAGSGLTGVVIIDTRPDLDPFTCNALFASDRVVVPVKDAASLDNCRHLFSFFDRVGLSRRAVRLLPCLIDSRVRYDGPFKDPLQLIRAYAINRGYRCLDGFIAKSPKVDSLNTNPEGKIHPILTHGRNTEAHQQFTHLARQLLQELRQEPVRRLAEVALAQDREEQECCARIEERRQQMLPHCALCLGNFGTQDTIAGAGYYWETGHGTSYGFLDDACFSSTVFRHFFGSRDAASAEGLRELFRDSAARCYFVLAQPPENRGHFKQQLGLYRFDEDGHPLSRKVIDFPADFPAAPPGSPCLKRWMEQACGQDRRQLGTDLLLVRRVGTDFPEEVLLDASHRTMREIAARIHAQLR